MSKKEENPTTDDDWSEIPVEEVVIKKDALVLRIERYALDNNIGKVAARAAIKKADLIEKINTLKNPMKHQEVLIVTREVLLELTEALL